MERFPFLQPAPRNESPYRLAVLVGFFLALLAVAVKTYTSVLASRSAYLALLSQYARCHSPHDHAPVLVGVRDNQ